MSPRTLPVTPAERHLATALRAWLEWCNDGAQMKGTEDATMMDMWPVLQERGFVTEHYGQPTPAGAALLARVEEAPVLEPTAAIVAFIRAEETRYRRNSKDPAHDAAGRERCANKASVLATVAAYIERGDHLAPPIDAPRASPERRPRPVPRQECARCDQYYSYGTGVIAPCKDSPYRHGKDGPGWRDPLHKWDTIDAPPAKEPAR